MGARTPAGGSRSLHGWPPWSGGHGAWPALALSAGCLALGAAGCDGPRLPPPAPQLLWASVDDGAPVSPTATLALRWSQSLDPATVDAAAVVLVRGAIDDDLRGRLDRGAPLDDDRQLLVPLRPTLAGDGTLLLLPARPLAPLTLHTLLCTTRLASGGRALAAPVERAFHSGPATQGAPWIELLEPAAGSEAVVRNLREVTVRWSRPVTGVDAASALLRDEAGEAVATRWAASGDGQLARLSLLAPLRALRRYHLEVADSVRDSDGEAPFLPDPPPGFTAGLELRSGPPVLEGVALSASSGCLVARLGSRPPAAARLCLDDRCGDEDARAATHELTAALAPGGSAAVRLVARDESTAPAAALGPLPAPASSPRPLLITEVLSRPSGSHYAQQYVALANLGDAPVSLAGLVLQVDGGRSVLPAGVMAGGAAALVVPAGFVAAAGGDGATPALVRLADGKLGGRGVLSDGSELALLEPDGRPVSRFSTAGLKLAIGQSARRVDRCDRPGAYQPSPGSGATPRGP